MNFSPQKKKGGNATTFPKVYLFSSTKAMRKIEKENEFNREEDLTIEELRSSPEFEKFSDEEVLQIIEFLKTYSYLVYQTHRKINCCEDENEMVIELNNNNPIKLAA